MIIPTSIYVISKFLNIMGKVHDKDFPGLFSYFFFTLSLHLKGLIVVKLFSIASPLSLKCIT